MISRYDRKEISDIWTEESKYKYMLEAELAIIKAFEGTQIPEGTSDTIRKKATINVERVHEIEKETKHDVIAFCTSITENIEPKVSKFFHYGVTSSDIIDTGQSLQIKESLKLILDAYKGLLTALKNKCQENQDLICIGRSHGMYAEPMSFGQKLLGHYAEFSRRYNDLKDYYDKEITGQFSGAVGNYTILTPSVEKEALNILGLNVEPQSTQVIPRDRIAKLISINALIGSAIERLCVEIRHLHRSDVNELHEGFSKGQKGSSTMPHKKNPISAENLTGISRVLRSHLSMALENTVLWHERDISHSSSERLYLPDNLGLLFYAVKRLTSTVENLVIHNEKVEAKVKENITYLSSYYLHFLIEKTDLTREELYKIVQVASFESESTGSHQTFEETILKELQSRDINLDVPKVDWASIKKIYTEHAQQVFERVFTEDRF